MARTPLDEGLPASRRGSVPTEGDLADSIGCGLSLRGLSISGFVAAETRGGDLRSPLPLTPPPLQASTWPAHPQHGPMAWVEDCPTPVESNVGPGVHRPLILSPARLMAPNTPSATPTPVWIASWAEDTLATIAAPWPGLSQAPQVWCSPPTQASLLTLRWNNGPAGPGLRGCERRWNVFNPHGGCR